MREWVGTDDDIDDYVDDVIAIIEVSALTDDDVPQWVTEEFYRRILHKVEAKLRLVQ